MKSKSKTSAKGGPASGGKKSIKTKKYEAHYLALILIGVLLLQGMLMTATSKTDWSAGSEVLDLSVVVSETSSDLAVFFQPIADTVAAVNEFYRLAATEMMPMLDMTSAIDDASLAINGVNEFYSQAATQMAQLLDTSSVASWPAKVAGVSITVEPTSCQ